VVERLWNGSVDLITNPRNPRGCFMVQSALACGDEADGQRREMVKRRVATETLLGRRATRLGCQS
jgi:hypothetical protein